MTGTQILSGVESIQGGQDKLRLAEYMLLLRCQKGIGVDWVKYEVTKRVMANKGIALRTFADDKVEAQEDEVVSPF